MNFLFDSKHRAAHFYKILRNTRKEIKSIPGFSPRNAFDIPISQAQICGDRADVSSPLSHKLHLFIPWCGCLSFKVIHRVHFPLASRLLNIRFT